jgi:hypothetical protein
MLRAAVSTRASSSPTLLGAPEMTITFAPSSQISDDSRVTSLTATASWHASMK